MSSLAKSKKIVFIIGAPRSGTNMLRDFICLHPEITCFPCDEIPFLWRFGAQFSETDILQSNWHETKSASKVKKIFKRWMSWHMNKNKNIFIEKTCPNSLRVWELSKLFPEAKFIFIFRSGFDVIASAERKKRHRDMSRTNIFSKLKFVPVTQIIQVVLNIIYQKVVHGIVAWGPRITDNPRLLKNSSDNEYVASQWMQCVNFALNDSAKISSDRCIYLGYENFVIDPKSSSDLLANFMGVESSGFANGLKTISTNSINKGADFANSAHDDTFSAIQSMNKKISNRITKKLDQ